MENKNKPAYPTNARMHSDAQGMTKREAFAMAAMQGLLASTWGRRAGSKEGKVEIMVDQIVTASTTIADEILKQLSHDPNDLPL